MSMQIQKGKFKSVYFLRYLVIYLLMVSPFSTFSQDITFSLKTRNITIQRVFRDITTETGYYFSYDSGLFDDTKKIDIDFRNADLESCFRQIFPNKEVKYELVGRNIVIRSIDEKIIPVKYISGSVKDSGGAVIAGAYIVSHSNRSNYTISEPDGTFRMECLTGSVLQVSFLGMELHEFTVGESNCYNIILNDSYRQLEEIVVNGITEMDKRLFTGAANRFPAGNVLITGVTEVSRSLEGRSAGVVLSNVSGTFGASPKIRIRGATSIYGNSQPLWVLDGVIIEDALEINADELASGNAETLLSSAVSGLNPDDIESFQILKDGAATSIYGGRAMAGVIVITTKKGHPGESRINYTGELSIRSKPIYGNRSILNSWQQSEIFRDMVADGWFSWQQMSNESSYGIYGKMYELYGEENRDYLLKAAYRNTDWFDVLFRNSLVQSHSVSYSGGNDKSTQYASVGIMDDPGWSVQSKVRRMTANLNYTQKIRHNLSANLITTASYRTQNAPGTIEQETDYRSGTISRPSDINPYRYAMNASRTLDPEEYYRYGGEDFNILHELRNNYMKFKVTDLKFQGQLRWVPFESLELSALAAFRRQDNKTSHNVSSSSNLFNTSKNEGTGNYKMLYSNGSREVTSRDLRLTASWKNNLNNKNSITVLAGTEVRAIERNSSGYTLNGTNENATGYRFNPEGDKTMNTSYRDVAFFGSVTYAYDRKYIVNATSRYEGTNRMGSSEQARWLPTGNISGRWNIHEEKFLRQSGSLFSSLSLRTSFSLTADTGPDATTISDLSMIQNTAPRPPYPGIGQNGLQISSLENRDLTYEKKREFNLGLDIGFLNGRVNISMDYYHRHNFDLIGMVTTQGVDGQQTNWGNFAAMKAHGYELSVSSANISTPDFRWSTDLAFWTGRTKITKLESDSYIFDLISGYGYVKEGYPVRSLFSIGYLGLDEIGQPILQGPDGPEQYVLFNSQQTGHLIYEGPTDPTVSGSLGNNFRYRNFSFNIYMTYSFGNKVRLNPIFSNKHTDFGSMPVEMLNRWRSPGDESLTDIPAILPFNGHDSGDARYAYTAYNYTSLRVADGGFIRLKEISLTYDFPKKLIQNWKIKNLSLKLQATNICLLYSDRKLHGQDPEYHNSGGVSMPVPLQFTFTLKLGL